MNHSQQKHQAGTAQKSSMIFLIWVLACLPLLLVFVRGCTLHP